MVEHNNTADLFQLAELMPFNDVHFWRDPHSQLEAIIVIHSTKLGPALGGCRFVPYTSSASAIKDALMLAKGMSYKSAIQRLPFGGGKAVILKPDRVKNRKALFESFGEFVETLNGRYITAVDSGTNIEDMDVIASKTSHVACTSTSRTNIAAASGDPSPYTAQGVYHGIRAAVQFQLKRDSLEGIHVALQGAGHVGYQLAKLLNDDGARLSVTDLDGTAIDRVVRDFGATAVSLEKIHTISSDVFSPCALGQTINRESIKNLNTKIVAGSANNQLQNGSIGELLLKKGILYAPDYVINSGGMLQIAYLNDVGQLNQKLAALYDILLEIFKASSQRQIATASIANEMAEAVLDNGLHDTLQPSINRKVSVQKINCPSILSLGGYL